MSGQQSPGLLSGGLVYRPGEPKPFGSIFATWANLMLAVGQIAGPKTILVDASLTGNIANVPAGSWNLDDCEFVGSQVTALHFLQGATIQAQSISLKNMIFESESTVSVWTIPTGTSPVFYVRAGLVQSLVGAAPLIDIPPGNGLTVLLDSNAQLGIGGVTPTVQVDGTVQFILTNSTISQNAVSGVGNYLVQGSGTINGPQSVTPTVTSSGIPIPSGTIDLQSTNTPQLLTYASTVNAAAITVDTKYTPSAGHGAKLDITWIATDRANNRTRVGNGNAALQNYGGVVSVEGSLFGGSVGTAALNGAVPSLSIIGGTLRITVTPPGAYAGNLDWVVSTNVTED